MEFTQNKLEELVKACGGKPEKVEGYLEELENNKPKTINELKDYPFKEHYSSLIKEEKAPMFRKYIISLEWDRHETITLDYVLDMIEDYINDEDCKNDKVIMKEIEQLKQELIDLCFGSMEYDW